MLNSTNIRGGLWPVRKRMSGVQYFLEHHYGFFYILTNAPSENMVSTSGGYYLARCRAEKSLLDKWQVSVRSTVLECKYTCLLWSLLEYLGVGD